MARQTGLGPDQVTRALPVLRIVCAVLLTLLLGAGGRDAQAADSLGQVERAFKSAIDRTFPATVVCTAKAPKRSGIGSSGVIVSRKGLVLSDGDVGSWLRREGKKWEREHAATVSVRVPKLRGGGFETYDAEVLHRNRDLDTSLLRITDPPRGGFPDFVPTGRSAHLRVGTFTFAAGNAFAMSAEAPPTLTAGIVASLTYLPTGSEGGPYEFIYTSAAVNPGVNGGPLVDVGGVLVGTVSTYIPANATDPYQYLGKVIPMDRLRAYYSEFPEGRELFPRGIKGVVSGLRAVRDLETVFHHTGREAYPRVVSLEIKRGKPVSFRRPVGNALANVARYQGPISGVLADAEGTIVTSLYNVTNVTPLLDTRWPAPPEHSVGGGVAAITNVTAHFDGGLASPYRVASYHEGLGIAVLVPAEGAPPRLGSYTANLIERAPLPSLAEEAFEPGRFLLAVARPFGAGTNPDPLMTFGILAKRHVDEGTTPWAGLWQTDAGATDGTCGGAAVDMRGRLYGLLTLWDPMRHGRNSGIGFVLPWPRIANVLAEMRGGRTFARPLLGVTWDVKPKPGGGFDTSVEPRIKTIVPDSAAAKAGLEVGDVIIGIGDTGIAAVEDVGKEFAGLWSGAELKLVIKRGAETLTVEVVLGARN